MYDQFIHAVEPAVDGPVQPSTPPILAFEDALVDRSTLYDSPLLKQKFKRIPNTIRDDVSYFQKIESDSTAWGKAVVTVDAPAASVFARRWLQNSYENTMHHVKMEGDDALQHVVHVPNSHSMLYATLIGLSRGVLHTSASH